MGELKYEAITGKIIGLAMTVHSTIGSGFQEVIYQTALEKEFIQAGIKYKREFEMPIYYKGEIIGLRRVDFIVEDLICVELKAIKQLEPLQLAQARNYLEAFNLEVGLLINFGAISLQFKRIHNPKFVAEPGFEWIKGLGGI